VKLRITGFEEVVDDPPDEPDVDPVPEEVVEPLELLEPDVPDDDEEPDVPLLDDDDDELLELELVVPVLAVDDEPAFLVVFAFDFEVVPVFAVPVVPLVSEVVPCALDPPAAEPELPPCPVELPTPFPVPVVAPVPPTSPIKASTWQRTVALLALSIVPFSTTTVSTSPESISTKYNGTLAPPNKFAGRYPACHAKDAPPRHTKTATILTIPQ
jgi:hypothetical protein